MNKIVVALLLSLAGCVTAAAQQNAMSQQQIDNINQKWLQVAQQCRQGKFTRENAIQRRDCVDNAMLSSMQETHYPHMSIALQRVAANKKAAIAYAKGKISEDEYKAALQQNEADAATAEEAAYQADQRYYRAQEDAYRREQESKPTMKDITDSINLNVMGGGTYNVTPEEMAAHRMNPSIPLPSLPPLPTSQHTNCYRSGDNLECDTNNW